MSRKDIHIGSATNLHSQRVKTPIKTLKSASAYTSASTCKFILIYTLPTAAHHASIMYTIVYKPNSTSEQFPQSLIHRSQLAFRQLTLCLICQVRLAFSSFFSLLMPCRVPRHIPRRMLNFFPSNVRSAKVFFAMKLLSAVVFAVSAVLIAASQRDL